MRTFGQIVLMAGMVLLTGAIGLGSLGTDTNEAAAAEKIDGANLTYAKDIKPILEDRCASCHNTSRKRAGIDLKGSYESVLRTVKPEKPEDSRLYKALIGKGARQMPPRKKLSDEEIETIKAWIAAGAKKT